jgi:hypothetical protein
MNKFPEKLINKLEDVHGGIFDYVRLKNKLEVLYCLDEFYNKSVYELLQFLVENDLSLDFLRCAQTGRFVNDYFSNYCLC